MQAGTQEFNVIIRVVINSVIGKKSRWYTIKAINI